MRRKKHHHHHEHRAVAIEIVHVFDGIKVEGFFTMVTLSTTQFYTFIAQPVDSLGNPAPVQDGSFTVVSSDPTVATAVIDPAVPNQVKVTPLKAGTVTITVTANADVSGATQSLISGTDDATITQALAVGFKITENPVQNQ